MNQLTVGQAAPNFTTTDVYGKTIRLSDFLCKTVLLVLHRNVGCPVCNVRFHELEKQQAELRNKGIEVLAIYESSAKNMMSYLDGMPQPFARMIPDPEEKLYNLYGAERSMMKMLSGAMLHGGMAKMGASKKLTPTLPKQDGHMDRIGAEFLINPTGQLIRVHYHRFLGDDLPLTEVINAGTLVA